MNKTSDSQRKSPQQSRSKAVVEAILDATVRILPTLGSRNITTRKIADLAGVSVGSLYQYFPNKESVLTAIIDKAMAENADEFDRLLASIEGKSLEESISVLVDLALDLFLGEREKIREIYVRAPELGRLPALLKVRQTFVERLALAIRQHDANATHENSLRTSFVAVNSVMGVIYTMLYDESQTHRRELLARELKTMLGAYLKKP